MGGGGRGEEEGRRRIRKTEEGGRKGNVVGHNHVANIPENRRLSITNLDNVFTRSHVWSFSRRTDQEEIVKVTYRTSLQIFGYAIITLFHLNELARRP